MMAVQQTSIDSYREKSVDDTEVQLCRVLFVRHQMLADFELQALLQQRGVSIPLSSVSARRHDVMKLYKKAGFRFPVIVNSGEKKRNPLTGKKCIVWRYTRGEYYD